jgi:hypothetical protein
MIHRGIMDDLPNLVPCFFFFGNRFDHPPLRFDSRVPLPYLTAVPLVSRAIGIAHARVGFP